MQGFLTRGLPSWVWWLMWLSVGLLAWFNLLTGRPGLKFLSPPETLGWVAAYLAFAAGFWWASRDPHQPGTPTFRVRLAVTLGLSALVIALGTLSPHYGDHGGLLILTAALAASLLPQRGALLWVAAQSVAFALTLRRTEGVFGMLYLTTAFLVMQVFAAATVRAMREEARARAELAASNAELREARERLAEASREAERLRIARELHDVLGHHLTVLHMNLEVTEHLLAPGEALGHVRRAHDLARLLLSDVRATVGQLREGPGDFALALRQVAHDAPGLHVHLDLPGDLVLTDAERAQTVLRAVQEIFTNTLRHAGARNLWLSLERDEDGVRFTARDDGRGAAALEVGHGLKGMRERLEALGGHVSFSSPAGEGFTVRAWLPAALPEGAARPAAGGGA